MVTQALANTAGPATALRDAGLPIRPPDYATVTISFSPPNPITRGWVGVSLQLTKDRFGDWYRSPGVNVGKSPLLVGAVTAAWILDRHAESQQEVEAFITSYSLSVGAFSRVGFQATRGNLGQMQANATAIEVGFSTGPQFGASLTNTAEVYEQFLQ